MQSFDSDGVRIAYVDEGEGEPILLIHGFASNVAANWRDAHWVRALTEASRRLIAYDNRGHGRSEKLYDPSLYGAPTMAEDARRLLDHLGIARADVMGYSMGARIAAYLAVNNPARVRAIILGGLGIRLVEGVGLPESIADALEAPSLADVTDPAGRLFRTFAEQTKSNLKALAACIRGSRQTLSSDQVAGIAAPALVAVGTLDPIAGSAQSLADLIPGARALDIAARDHMTAVGDKAYKTGVLDFLNQRA
jgi:pimeloyl-ACP methyl ester carboxylesterase